MAAPAAEGSQGPRQAAMISPKLQGLFFTIEAAAFQEWRAAGPERKAEICKQIGEMEARWIIAEIEKEAAKLRT